MTDLFSSFLFCKGPFLLCRHHASFHTRKNNKGNSLYPACMLRWNVGNPRQVGKVWGKFKRSKAEEVCIHLEF